MISAGRRNGLTTVPIQGIPALLKELDAGHPVIVFENLGLSWMPQWHYAIVFGYDLNEKKLLMHSGPDSFKEEKIATFELSWRLADYWGMVVLGPGELSATGDELSHATSAAAMENLGLNEEAQMAYNAILKKWPKSVSSYIGLGNISYQQGQFQNSVSYLKKAVEIAPDMGAAQHNLQVAEKALKSETEKSVVR
jgi:tetratricopeptide (TPR) repeat protein